MKKSKNKRLTKVEKEKTRKETREKSDGEKKIMVTILYVKGISVVVQHTLRRHGITTAHGPIRHQTAVSPPKDKREMKDTMQGGVFHSLKGLPHGVYWGNRNEIWNKTE